MTKIAQIFRHVAFEDLGAFAAPLHEAGYAIRYAEMGVDGTAAAEEADLLIILGGPIGAYQDDLYPWLRDEIGAIAKRLREAKPTLGICLGAQLMARALGAKVYPGPAKEIGFARLLLSAAGNVELAEFSDIPFLHWHGDTFDLPEGAVRLASTPVCENQAFSLGKNVLAFQFHPEAEPAGFERWLIGHTGEIAAEKDISVQGLRAQMREHGMTAAARGCAMLRRWLENQQ